MGVPPFLGDNMRTITAVNESPHKSYGITGVRWPLRSSDVIQGGGLGGFGGRFTGKLPI